MMRVNRFGLSHKSASIIYLKLSRSLVKPGYTVIPPSDSRLKLTMSPCFNPTSSTQSLGRETIRVEYPTFWTFRASIIRDIVLYLYTISWDNGRYILELVRKLYLYFSGDGRIARSDQRFLHVLSESVLDPSLRHRTNYLVDRFAILENQ